MGACLVASLLCLPARAADVIDVERAVLVVDGGAVAVDGGVWLSDARALELARQRVECREANRALTASAGVAEASTVAAVAGGALLLGVAAGVAVGLAVRR